MTMKSRENACFSSQEETSLVKKFSQGSKPCKIMMNGMTSPPPSKTTRQARNNRRISKPSPEAGMGLSAERVLEPSGLHLKVARAILARLLLAIHGLVAVWRNSTINRDIVYYSFAAPIIMIFIEGAIRILFFEANESRWFCLSILLYLCSVVPSLWFMQLNLDGHLQNITGSAPPASDPKGEKTTLNLLIGDVEMFIPIKPETWVVLLEQTLVVVLILSRWLLPRGRISRDHLSQMLLVWLAVGADIVDLYDILDEKLVSSRLPLTLMVLVVWTTSLLQFPVQLTGRSRRARSMYARRSTEPSIVPRRSVGLVVERVQTSVLAAILGSLDVWSILITTILQDGPFLGLRLFFVFRHHLINYSMIYFTCKNTLVVLLQLYRLYGVICRIVEDVKAQMPSPEPKATIEETDLDLDYALDLNF